MAESDSVQRADRRDELITLVRRGEVTPEEAEAEALENGWEPFAKPAELPAFDPMLESHWSICMTVAWIAWRDLQLVRKNSARFRSESTQWIFREWNEPSEGGTGFDRREGWFLESWPEPTTARLVLSEILMQRNGRMPATRQMSVTEAERELWHALAEKKLVAHGLDPSGRPIDIPQREWAYLNLFEEGKRDVVKYDALDRAVPYTDVKLSRGEILSLWPLRLVQQSIRTESGLVDPVMIEPVTNPGHGGYVPLCCAIHWIMTRGGIESVAYDDEQAWARAVDKLFPLIHSDEIELIGIGPSGRLTEKIPGHSLTTVKVLPPFSETRVEIGMSAPSRISCSPYTDRDEWLKNFNDRLHIEGQPTPGWTHLQVKKADILRICPRPGSRIKPGQDCYKWLLAQMEQSPDSKPKARESFFEEGKKKFPGLSRRQFISAWEKAKTDSGAEGWSKAGRTKKSNRNTN